MNQPDYQKRFSALNEKQQEAVEHIYGPLLVLAGPGSGKTELLSLRVANILQKTDIPAGSILCLTYTDSAAINMRKRLAGLIGQEAYRVAVHTFHNFGVEIISRHPEFFYNAATFSPADQLMQAEVLQKIFDKLSYKDPLKKEHPEQGYVYLNHALRAIGNLKKAGIIPEEFLNIIEHNQKELTQLNNRANDIFGDRVSKKVFTDIQSLTTELSRHKSSKFPVDHFGPITDSIRSSLEYVLKECEAMDWSTKPVSEWKRDWVQKSESGRYVFKDFNYIDKLQSLANIYKQYTENMHALGYYDFDDMLLDTIQEVKRNGVLRSELQEQYQFVLVDEFQDTNDAQMRLLELLFEATDEQPNIMAVGDDDQAIFKFQGAELSNILKFKNQYNAKIINLLHNYRSTQELVDFTKNIIRKGRDRLENRFTEINKDLIAVDNKAKGKIFFKSFDTNTHEFYWIAHEIKNLIDKGKLPDDIAIISRQHKMLEGVVPFLHKFGIPVRYERQKDVLKEPHIIQLVQICRYINSLADKSAEADDLLPEILSYPFWGLDRYDIWKLSLEAYKNNTPWLGALLKSNNAKLKSLADFLLELGAAAKSQPAEQVLDTIVRSPFKEFYFGKEKQKSDLAEYLFFLSGLKTFYGALREYKHGQPIKIADLVQLVDSYTENKMSLTDESPFVNSKNAVSLLTAHKSKGMEFDTVFVISCQDRIWAKSFINSYLPFPQNLPISPAGDSIDDQLRLFYVALTRSKRNLYLTSYDNDEDGRESMKLNFITEHDYETEDFDITEVEDMLTASLSDYNKPPFYGSERVLLEERAKDYRMSVTHLNNFLNIAEGGPQTFFEQNFLCFPQSKTPSSSYGSAVHEAIEYIYIFLKREGKLLTIDQLNQRFEELLKKERMSDVDFAKYLERGKDSLARYFDFNRDKFKAEHLIENEFKSEGVIIGEAQLGGKIDKIVKDGTKIIVHDLKTGNAPGDAQGKGDYERIKLYQYKRQLVFYKLLVENSRSFNKYKVEKGVLEFVEAGADELREVALDVDTVMASRLEDLIKAVYAKIVKIDFPDISKYPPTLDGIIAFENDLIKESKVQSRPEQLSFSPEVL